MLRTPEGVLLQLVKVRKPFGITLAIKPMSPRGYGMFQGGNNMENKNFSTQSSSDLENAMEPLGIHQLEERLEVSSLVPGGQGQESNSALVENCCNDKCSGNDLDLDDSIDTGEIN